jgi:hypothetical protein
MPVGPYAKSVPVPGWVGALAILRARTGTANMHYDMRMPTQNYPVVKCAPQDTDGVVITFHASTKVLLTAYVSLRKTPVCTKLQSMSITGVAAGTGRY